MNQSQRRGPGSFAGGAIGTPQVSGVKHADSDAYSANTAVIVQSWVTGRETRLPKYAQERLARYRWMIEEDGIRRAELRDALQALAAVYRDPEADHATADRLLLAYINDDDVTDAFEAIAKWYA